MSPSEPLEKTVGILTRRFDKYVECKIASRNYSPSWAWEINFIGPTPFNYSARHGASEVNLKAGYYGRIICADPN